MLSRGMCVGGEEEEKKAFLTFVNNVDQPAMWSKTDATWPTLYFVVQK